MRRRRRRNGPCPREHPPRVIARTARKHTGIRAAAARTTRISGVSARDRAGIAVALSRRVTVWTAPENREKESEMEFRSVALLFALFALMTGRGFAQVPPSAPSDRTGEIRGTVEMPGVGGLAGLAVTLASAASSAEGNAPMAETRTDAEGAFAFTGVEPGRWVVSSRSDDGLAQVRIVVVVRPSAVAPAVLRLEVRLSEAVTVTDTRGARLKRETPASVGVVSREASPRRGRRIRAR